MNTQDTLARSTGTAVGGVRLAALATLIFGAAIVFTVGLSHSETLHNAAHDWRHSMGFPCH